MAKNYSYPRVTMSTLAKKHSHNVVNVPDTTIMFAPLVTEKGPDDQVVKVHTLSEFIEIFGSFNEDFYNWNGQMALNVYNWLSNGGTLMTKRLKGNLAANAKFELAAGTTPDTVEPKFEVLNGFEDGDFIAVKSVDNSGFIIIDKTKITVTTTTSGETTTYSIAVADNCVQYDYSANEGFKLINKPNTDYFFIIPTSKESETANDNFNWSEYRCPLKITIDDSANGDMHIEAKYHGEYYNGISLVAEEITDHSVTDENKRFYNFYVKYTDSFGKEVVLEKFLQKGLKNYAAALSKSEYIVEKNNCIRDLYTSPCLNYGDTELDTKTNKCVHTFRLNGGANSVSSFAGGTDELITAFWTSTESNKYDAASLLSNRLETPIDIIFDAGYNCTIKNLIRDFVRNDIDSTRPDIVFIADAYELSTGLRLSIPSDNNKFHTWTANPMPTNIAVYEQYFTILDSIFTSQQIYVTPSYFLSKLIAYNDLTYGIQYPTAGLRRGILDDALWVNHNPDPDQKEAWFQARVNYVEKSAREYAFMSQRTYDGSTDMDYTALSFLNNERVLERMKKDLETIGRSYLHEFNDAITIANMTTALNKYVANWISNRTLSMGVVEVVQDEISENALDINLNIRFTNTIEVINVSIVIE